jgi:MoaA/NifB/PqqE/SkfB family radical SAM enzyme
VSAARSEEYGRFSARLYGAARSPIRAQLELTYACNFHCVHCYSDPLNRPELLANELSTGAWLRLLEELQALGVLWICYTGGEPLLRPDFFELLQAAADRGFLVTLFSNGSTLGASTVERLVALRPFSIEISLHAATAATGAALTRAPGGLERSLAGLRLAVEAGLPVKVKTHGMTVNRSELDATRSLVERLGLRFSLNTALYPRLDGSVPEELRLSPEERVSLERQQHPDDPGARELQHWCTDADDGPWIGGTAPAELYRCGCGTTTVHVDPWGRVGACTWQREPRFAYEPGRLGPQLAQLFAWLRGRRYTRPTACRDCALWTACEKLAGVAAWEAQDEQDPVPHFCETARWRAAAATAAPTAGRPATSS